MSGATPDDHGLFLPGRVLIEAYGNGGFRFGGMSHRGNLILLPSGAHAWDAIDPARLTLDDLDILMQRTDDFDFLLLGTGARQVWPPSGLRRAFTEMHKGLDIMSTGAAVRTYNVLAAEERPVAAALVAVDTVRP